MQSKFTNIGFSAWRKYNTLKINKLNVTILNSIVGFQCITKIILRIFLMKKTNAFTKHSELTSVLNSHFQKKINLARVKLNSHFVIALCKVQTVTSEKLTNTFDTQAGSESSLRGIQRFITSYSLDSDLIARLILTCFPNRKNLSWVLTGPNGSLDKPISIYLCSVLFIKELPLLFTMLAKRGISNSQERIDLINRFIGFLIKKSLNLLLQIESLSTNSGWNF